MALHGGEFLASVSIGFAEEEGKEGERERSSDLEAEKHGNHFGNVTEQISNIDHRPHSYSTVQEISCQGHELCCHSCFSFLKPIEHTELR
jgi:hypothetical protein